MNRSLDRHGASLLKDVEILDVAVFMLLFLVAVEIFLTSLGVTVDISRAFIFRRSKI